MQEASQHQASSLKVCTSTPVSDNDNNQFRYYVYAWCYPDGRVFYIGKGCGRRDKRPKHQNNELFKRVVAKIYRGGGAPRVERWQDGICEVDALLLEVSYIKLFGRRDNGTGILANLTDGGEGASGFVPTEETRSKLSRAHAGNKNAVGHRHTEETLARLSASHTGKKHSAETLAKMSAAQSGRVVSADCRMKLSAVNLMSPPKSGFKGVSFNKGRGPNWRAGMRLNGKTKNLGNFHTAELAALAYDIAAYAAHGDNCYLNFGPPGATAA